MLCIAQSHVLLLFIQYKNQLANTSSIRIHIALQSVYSQGQETDNPGTIILKY